MKKQKKNLPMTKRKIKNRNRRKKKKKHNSKLIEE